MIARLILALMLIPALVFGAGTTTDKVTIAPLASPSCTSGRACLYAKSGDDRVYIVDSAGLELQSNAARSFRTSANCSGLSGPAVGDVCFDTTLDEFRYYTSGGWQSAVVEKPYMRTCTITSAAAATPITCLSDASVPPTQKAYLAGWHAKVNGATAWATTASCAIKDTSGAATPFVTLAVAALTGNAFIADHSSNVTQEASYARNLGTAADKGFVLVCDANGTGSDLVVTIYGVIK
jgi:hypothetical protein